MVKAKPVKKERSNIGDLYDSLLQIAFWGLCGIILLAPFFRGLFFPENQRIAIIFAVIIFWLVFIAYYKRNDFKFFSTPIDYLLLALPIVYLISMFNATNYSLALNRVLENTLYFLVFVSAYKLVTTEKSITYVLGVIYFTALGVALAGLMTATDIIDIKDGFIGSDGGTIASTLQYKNALASLLAAAIFIGTYLWGTAQKDYIKYILAGSNLILFSVFFSTHSHGGYIILGLFMIIYLFLNPPEARFKILHSTIVLSLLGYVSSRMFLQNIREESIIQGCLWIIASIMVALLWHYFIQKITNNRQIDISLKHLSIATGVATLVGTIAISQMGIIQKLLEKLHMHGALERITMYQDGLVMFLHKPVFGWGGGGWSEAYNMYQGYGYTSRQTHSYFLQLGIEAGFLGLLIAISIWAIFLLIACRAYIASIKSNRYTSLYAALICAVLAIISHAVFDFNLSLSSLTIIMYVLMACLLSIALKETPSISMLPSFKLNINVKAKLAITSLFSIIVLCVSLTLISSDKMANASLNAIAQGNLEQANELIDKSISRNPFAVDRYIIGAQIKNALGKQSIAEDYLEKALGLSRYNPDTYSTIANIYMNMGINDNAVYCAQKSVELAPLQVRYYEVYTNILVQAAINYSKEGQIEIANKQFKQAIEITNKMDDVLESVHPDKKKLWVYAMPLVETETIKFNIGVAHLFINNIIEADKYLSQVNNTEHFKDLLLYKALLAHLQGNEEEANTLIKHLEPEKPNVKEQFAELLNLVG